MIPIGKSHMAWAALVSSFVLSLAAAGEPDALVRTAPEGSPRITSPQPNNLHISCRDASAGVVPGAAHNNTGAQGDEQGSRPSLQGTEECLQKLEQFLRYAREVQSQQNKKQSWLQRNWTKLCTLLCLVPAAQAAGRNMSSLYGLYTYKRSSNATSLITPPPAPQPSAPAPTVTVPTTQHNTVALIPSGGPNKRTEAPPVLPAVPTNSTPEQAVGQGVRAPAPDQQAAPSHCQRATQPPAASEPPRISNYYPCAPATSTPKEWLTRTLIQGSGRQLVADALGAMDANGSLTWSDIKARIAQNFRVPPEAVSICKTIPTSGGSPWGLKEFPRASGDSHALRSPTEELQEIDVENELHWVNSRKASLEVYIAGRPSIRVWNGGCFEDRCAASVSIATSTGQSNYHRAGGRHQIFVPNKFTGGFVGIELNHPAAVYACDMYNNRHANVTQLTVRYIVENLERRFASKRYIIVTYDTLTRKINRLDECANLGVLLDGNPYLTFHLAEAPA